MVTGGTQKIELALFTRNGYNKIFPPFGATPLEDDPAVFALHPFTESVGTFSADAAGLIGSLAHKMLSLLFFYAEIFPKGGY